MQRILPPILFRPTREARALLGGRLRAAAACAFRELTLAASGLEIEHLQFEFEGLTLAICSHVRRDGTLVIEAGLGNARLPRRTFTADQVREAMRRNGLAQPPRRAGAGRSYR